MPLNTFLKGGGETGSLIRMTDWTKTSLGAIDQWPQSLKTTLSIILNSKFPMFLFWGPEEICFYNDAYRPSLGQNGKHPAIGKKGVDVFPEIWDSIKPLIDQVVMQGEATFSEDQLLAIYRNGQLEDVYWTFSYSPVKDESGAPAGVFVTCVETTEKVHSLNSLKRSKEEFQFAVDAAEFATWDLKPNTNLVKGNNRLRELFGVSGNREMELKDALEVIDDEDKQNVINSIQDALKYESGGVYNVTYKIVDPYTGNKKIVRAKGKALFNEAKEPYRFSGILQDITHQVDLEIKQEKVRKDLEDAEERIRLATKSADMGTFDFDLRNKTIITSDRFDEIFGFDRTMPHQEYVKQFLPEDLPIRTKAHEKAYATSDLNYQARLNINGQVRWMHAAGKVFYDEQQNPVRMLGTAVDITDQKLKAVELQNSKEQLEIALQAGKLGMYEYTIASGEMKCSPQCKANYGLEEDEILNFNDLLNVIVTGDRQMVIDAIKEAIDTHTNYNNEYQVRWPDDSIHWIKASGKPQYDNDGNAVSMVGVTFDITEHKNLQHQKDQFIGIASHELKTPVTSIKAYTQILEKILREKGNTNEASLISKMDLQINRLTGLIGDLLDVTKINSGRIQFNEVKFDFNEMVSTVVEDLQRTTNKNIVIKLTDDQCTLFGDKERISQVIVNLITNAIKYSPKADKILVYLSIDNDNVTLCVEDFGIGISADKQDKVFEQFYRVSGNMQHTFPGLGLGLYISAEIIKRLGGRIWVNSVENKGSTFCFSLPSYKESKD